MSGRSLRRAKHRRNPSRDSITGRRKSHGVSRYVNGSSRKNSSQSRFPARLEIMPIDL
jgi:hypothetical protein